MGTTVSSHTAHQPASSKPEPMGRERFLVSHGLEVSFSPFYSCAKPLKPKQGSLFRLQRRNLGNCSGCPHQVRNLKIKKPVPPKTPYPLDAVSCLPKVKESFMSFPSSPSNLLGSEPCMGSQPPGAWVPAFDCHRTGRLPPGSRPQEPDSCWSLVTPYPGGGSMSTVKLQIPSL